MTYIVFVLYAICIVWGLNVCVRIHTCNTKMMHVNEVQQSVKRYFSQLHMHTVLYNNCCNIVYFDMIKL